MKRILITGNAGAGKTTLAREVAKILDLPFHNLDRIVWQPGWKKTPTKEKERKIIELIARDSWVIDGVSFTVQDQAEVVVFLDIPRRLSFLRVIKRNWKYMFHSRPDLPPNCPEVLIIPRLAKIIWNFPARVRGQILERMTRNQDRQGQFHLKTNGDIQTFLDTLNQKNPTSRTRRG